MSTRWGRRPKKKTFARGEIRPSSLTRTQKPATKPSARELFAELRPRLLASRPVLEVVEHPYWRGADGKPVMVQRFGAPTFRNVIEDGVLK